MYYSKCHNRHLILYVLSSNIVPKIKFKPLLHFTNKCIPKTVLKENGKKPRFI